MAGYYNPYNFYQNTTPIMGGASFTPYNGYSYLPQPQQPQVIEGMKWVEGEVGAKAFQMPQNWPANQPIPLWDSTDTIIYLKSWGPMGVPNPMQKLYYTMGDTPVQNQQNIQLSGQSGETQPVNFATKDDLNTIKDEIQGLKDMFANKNNRINQNSNNNDNRGGNR